VRGQAIADFITFTTGVSLAVSVFGWPTGIMVGCFAYYLKAPWTMP
jgi:hypothetical protein